MSTALDKRVLDNNRKFASQPKNGSLNIKPASKLVIVTCMDCRIDPMAMCGFNTGEATIIRNAGAHAGEAVRSALLATHVLGAEDIYIVKHTDCGLLGVTTEFAHDVIKRNLDPAVSEAVDNFAIFPIGDLEKSAAEDVEYFRQHLLLSPKVRVTGWIYDTDSGKLSQVVE